MVYEKTQGKRHVGVWVRILTLMKVHFDSDQSTPPAGVRFLALSAGTRHTCGIREDTGEAVCWGLGSDPNAEEGEGSVVIMTNPFPRRVFASLH